MLESPVLPDVSERLPRRKSRNNCPYLMQTETPMRTEAELLDTAYQFLLERNQDKAVFSKEDFQKVVNSNGMFERYWLSGFVKLLEKADEVGPEQYRVGSAFGGCLGRKEFGSLILGMQREGVQYSFATHAEVMNYEFFMPVVHKETLKEVLDSLFFKDAVITRLKFVGLSEVQRHFPKGKGELDKDYFDRLCDWVGEKFGGYSMSKVDGRFRVGPLKCRADAEATSKERGGQYLVDEETVVVRFIFKCGESAVRSHQGYDGRVEMSSGKEGRAIMRDASLVQYFFWKLFVESIIESVNGEAEIWLVESGMRSCLHIWSQTPGKAIPPSREGDKSIIQRIFGK